jgi:hypothetical protein
MDELWSSRHLGELGQIPLMPGNSRPTRLKRPCARSVPQGPRQRCYLLASQASGPNRQPLGRARRIQSCCRKVIILDLAETDALHILALAAAILALGVVYWLIGYFDRRRGDAEDAHKATHRLLRKTGSFSSAARLAPGTTM